MAILYRTMIYCDKNVRFECLFSEIIAFSRILDIVLSKVDEYYVITLLIQRSNGTLIV